MWYYGERTPRRCGMNILMLEDDPVEPQIIKTVRGMGYKVDE